MRGRSTTTQLLHELLVLLNRRRLRGLDLRQALRQVLWRAARFCYRARARSSVQATNRRGVALSVHCATRLAGVRSGATLRENNSRKSASQHEECRLATFTSLATYRTCGFRQLKNAACYRGMHLIGHVRESTLQTTLWTEARKEVARDSAGIGLYKRGVGQASMPPPPLDTPRHRNSRSRGGKTEQGPAASKPQTSAPPQQEAPVEPSFVPTRALGGPARARGSTSGR